MHFKDAILDSLAARANIAQFASYSPALESRFSRVTGFPINTSFSSVAEAAAALIARSADHSVNVRSFDPHDPKSKEFVYGVATAAEAAQHVTRLAEQGLYTILNETIDVHDGGVSGVALGNLIEFAPEDTPRCVELPGTVSLPRALGIRLLETVYGFSPDLAFGQSTRVEFSIHPIRRGVRNEHTIVWELEEVGESHAEADIRWPNRFSEHIGDKAFGLLVAHLFGLPVPRTTVIPRRLAPFSFGRPTGTREPWLRTAPRVQTPGKFTTRRGWLDPFTLLNAEDPSGVLIGSVLLQEGVDARYSGAALASEGLEGPELTIEGTVGFGDQFMVGLKGLAHLPPNVTRSVRRLYMRAFESLGYVRFEWVASESRTWIVQFHRGASPSSGRIIYPGEASHFVRFETTRGLEALRDLIPDVAAQGAGIILIGDVGITSHFGDVLRKARIPAKVA